MKARLGRALGLGLCAFLLLSMGRPPALYHFSRPLMHTVWDFTLVAGSEAQARKAFEAAAAEVERLDQALAMWRPESDVAAFNAKAGQGPQAVGADLDAVLDLGLRLSELSRGALDCSVGPLVQLWHHSLKKGGLPPENEVQAARGRVDYRRIRRHGDGRWSAEAGTLVDLGSLAKGYAQDRVAALLMRHGIHAYLLNAGGQVYAKGSKPAGQAWKVGILHPRDEARVVAVMPLTDQAMATSGDYEQSKTVGGRRYHHIMDPRTGKPTAHGTCSVTVILPLAGTAGPGALCDGLATAALVLGQGEGQALLEKAGASGLLLQDTGQGRLKSFRTQDLDALDVVLEEPGS